MKTACILAAVAAAIAVTPATAAPVHLNFTGVFASGPYSNLSGTVDYSFDNGNFTLLDAQLTVGSQTLEPLGIPRFYPGFGSDLVNIGDFNQLGRGDGFFLGLDLDSYTGAAFDDGDLVLAYSQSGSSSVYQSERLELNPPSGAVPEATTWAMMVLGAGAVGWGLRRKRTRVMVTYSYVNQFKRDARLRRVAMAFHASRSSFGPVATDRQPLSAP